MTSLLRRIEVQLTEHHDAALERLVLGTPDPRRMAQLFTEWCRAQLQADVVGAWLWAVSVGVVAGLELDDGRRVVVKARPPDRSASQLGDVAAVQRMAADSGLPAPLPIAGPARLGRGWATAETALATGRRPQLLTGTDRDTVAAAWSRVTDVLDGAIGPSGSVPAVGVVDGLYPVPHSPLFDFDATSTGAEWIDDLAGRARRVMRAAPGELRVVHTDWRSDNLRVSEDGSRVVAIYDWDSVRLDHEVAALGQVAAMHSVDWSDPTGPYFATGAECIAFARAVEAARSAPFSADEWPSLRAAIVYGWCYTARCEHARAAVGDDKPQFGMRSRLRQDGAALLGDR